MTQGPVHVMGTRSFAAEVVDFARDAGLSVLGLLEPAEPDRIGSLIYGLPVKPLDDGPAEHHLVLVGTGDVARREAVARLEQAGWQVASLVHPRAHLAPSARLGVGALIGPGVVVGAAAAVGDHVVIGRGALVGHHTEIGAFSTLGPGANVAGNVRIDEDVFLGMGSTVRDHTVIGASTVVAMGAVVTADAPPGAQLLGIPARTK